MKFGFVLTDKSTVLDEYQNSPTSSNPQNTAIPRPVTKTIDEKVEELNESYSETEILMIKRIFRIIDTRFGKKSYETFVKNIKESVLLESMDDPRTKLMLRVMQAFGKTAAHIYKAVEAKKEQGNLLSFDDLIAKTQELMNNDAVCTALKTASAISWSTKFRTMTRLLRQSLQNLPETSKKRSVSSS